MASAMGVARMPTQGSCRPVVSMVVAAPRTSIVRRGMRMLDVGLSAIDAMTSCPVEMPPSKPPLLLEANPAGVISSASDPQGRRTVVDLVAPDLRLYPVGRLDYESEGLILLTNDGDLANRVTHPRYGIVKKYVALIKGNPGKGEIRRLMEGIDLDDGPASALSAQVVGRQGEATLIELTMGEGRNREVRRMFEALGFEVSSLVRTAIGPITDRSLKPGQSRQLSAAEIRDLLASGTGVGP